MRTARRCDGISRRQVIQGGLLGLAELALPEVLRLRTLSAASGSTNPDTAVIHVMLGGGTSQFETYDSKPSAPADIRGEFNAISTNVPGVQFCELMAQQARILDELTIVHSIHHPTSRESWPRCIGICASTRPC